ncbi:hypothetical protein ACHAWF_019043 [Thalassiosira exigua]
MADATSSSTDRGLASFIQNVGGVTDSIKDSLKDNFFLDIKGIKSAGAECHVTAKETSQICTTTTSKASQLITYGCEMKAALDGFSDGVDAQDFAAIGAILTSDKIHTVLSLASEMDDLAISCARQSSKMIDAIDAGIETLPDILEKNVDKRMENAKQDGSKEGDPEIPNLENDVRALEDTARCVRQSNPINAIEWFQKAFDGITTKGELCRDMFATMRDFANDVAGVSEAIENFKFGKLVGHIKGLVKDIWRCLRLSDLIRSFARAAEKLIKWIVEVIKAVMEKIKELHVKNIADCGYCVQVESTLESLGIKTSDLNAIGMQLLKCLG